MVGSVEERDAHVHDLVAGDPPLSSASTTPSRRGNKTVGTTAHDRVIGSNPSCSGSILIRHELSASSVCFYACTDLVRPALDSLAVRDSWIDHFNLDAVLGFKRRTMIQMELARR